MRARGGTMNKVKVMSKLGRIVVIEGEIVSDIELSLEDIPWIKAQRIWQSFNE
jgi:hypothetical protein